jgi:hypothetical protein
METTESLLDIEAMLGVGRKHGGPHEHIGSREFGEDFEGIREAATGVVHPDEVIGEEGGAVEAMEAEEDMGLPADAQVFLVGAADEEMVEEAVGDEEAELGHGGDEMEGFAEVAMPAQGKEALLGEGHWWRGRWHCLSQWREQRLHTSGLGFRI